MKTLARHIGRLVSGAPFGGWGSKPAITTATLVLAAAVIIGIAALLAQTMQQRMLKEHALHESLRISKLVGLQISGIREIIRTGKISAPDQAFINNLHKSGEMFRFNLFDHAGRLAFISDSRNPDVRFTATLAGHNEKALEALLKGNSYSEISDGSGKADRPEIYAETYVPVIRNGLRIAVIETYLDVTKFRDELFGSFLVFAAQLTGLITLSLIIPGILILLLILRLKRQNHEVNMARIRAMVAERAKSSFMANMSHELRTPLNAIQGLTQVMIRGDLGPLEHPKYLEYTKDINASGRHLLSLINDILDFSKIELGKTALNETRFDLSSVLAETVRVVASWEKGARLTFDTTKITEPAMVFADQRAIAQIAINLLSNATKFTPDGGRVSVSIEHTPKNALVVTVNDTGIGIPETDIQNLMKPFSNAEDNAHIANTSGRGLGLPLSRALIQAHGGELHIHSQRGAGTTVQFTLPPSRVMTVAPPRNGSSGPHALQPHSDTETAEQNRAVA
jgi:signal transduction histidine kinase